MKFEKNSVFLSFFHLFYLFFSVQSQVPVIQLGLLLKKCLNHLHSHTFLQEKQMRNTKVVFIA